MSRKAKQYLEEGDTTRANCASCSALLLNIIGISFGTIIIIVMISISSIQAGSG